MDAVETVGCIGFPGAPCTDSGEHDGGSLIIDPKRLESALVAMSLKEWASSGRKPPLLARRKNSPNDSGHSRSRTPTTMETRT